MMSTLQKLVAPTGGWKRQTACLVVIVVVSAGLSLAAGKPRFTASKSIGVSVSARVLEGFDKQDPAKTRFGQLEWRGGLELNAASRHFGGWSGLALDSKGQRLLAVSDAGLWMRAEISYRGNRIAGLGKARIGPLRALSGNPLSRSRDRDAEALTIIKGDVDRGLALISFEQNDRIGVFPVGKNGVSKPQRYLKVPTAIRLNRSSDGVESLAVLQAGPHKGATVTFLENTLTKNGSHTGWLLHRGKAHSLTVADMGGYSLTDLAALPDGDLLLLERRFRWSEGVKMRLRVIAARDIKPGAHLAGEVVVEADQGQNIDNMEGLAVHRNRGGEIIVTLISDDNFNRLLQRTVILQFAMLARSTKEAASAESRR